MSNWLQAVATIGLCWQLTSCSLLSGTKPRWITDPNRETIANPSLYFAVGSAEGYARTELGLATKAITAARADLTSYLVARTANCLAKALDTTHTTLPPGSNVLATVLETLKVRLEDLLLETSKLENYHVEHLHARHMDFPLLRVHARVSIDTNKVVQRLVLLVTDIVKTGEPGSRLFPDETLDEGVSTLRRIMLTTFARE
ncbi:MAG: hypothetical protein A2284_02785 [Deltaproteobacteria bacterium RIFOXYA12_FULL_61_11]|nr:MAG: hypothetical protein A2284_02785 [Deltaproteobacteria bacterium RIFOXYA12_FULL_61_11]